MLLAVRPGTDGILIPHEFRERYRGIGCTFFDAPPGFVEVSTPTPLSEAKRSEPVARVAIPPPASESTTATEIAAPAPRQRRRGRGPGD